MGKAKIAITLDEDQVKKIDRLVRDDVFGNRSQAIQQAVTAQLQRLDHTRLARECAKLDKAFEQAIADEGLSEDLGQWPEY